LTLTNRSSRTHMTQSGADGGLDSSPVAATPKPVPGACVAIVTDGMWRKSLSAIRALGKAGFHVHVLGDSWITVGFWSRFAGQRVLAPDAKQNAAGFGRILSAHLESIAAAMPPGIKPVLLPMEEDSLRYLVKEREALRFHTDFLAPEPDALAVCLDKGATMALAARLGIPHPRTDVAESATALLQITADFAGSEFVVKPLRGSGSRGVRYNPSFDAKTVEAYWQSYGPALVQERIASEGDAIGVSLLFGADGACLAHFCHKRLQQYPNSGGPSTDRIGINNPLLLNQSLTLLRALKWAGVAMVEWKIDPRDATAKLMEINPRFWGSLELAIRSGVNFPVLYAQAAAGQPTMYAQPLEAVRCRWLVPGDILRWITARASAREPLSTFLNGLPHQAEEWDRQDISGMLACVICQGIAVLQPKYWKFLSR
jgi:predicted ATP-grasp superfamily ATP-dependent carboligase